MARVPLLEPPFADVNGKILPIHVEVRVPAPKQPPGTRLRPRSGADFTKALIEMNRTPTSSRAMDLAISITLHVLVIAVPVVLSLAFTDTLNLRSYTATLLVAPPPPPPPPPPAAPPVVAVKTPRRVFTVNGKLVAPTMIPRRVAEIKEAPLPDVPEIHGVAGGVPGGIPGGVLGGTMGGVLGGVLGSTVKTNVPPPVALKVPIRVGGRVRPPRPVLQVQPDYPPLARQTRIQGRVLLDAIIDTQGNIVDVKIVSGHPLLYQAALDAVRKWKYEPTYLNDEPVAVQMNVTVTFQLQ